jgi:hypothetical protein
MSKKSIDIPSLEDVLNYKPQPKIALVKVGPWHFKLREPLDPTALSRVATTAKSRGDFGGVTIKNPDTGQEERLEVEAGEAYLYTALELCLVEPKLEYHRIIELSKKTKEDCVLAGEKALELCGFTEERVTEAKNASREGLSQEPPTIEPSGGNAESSLPA